jgi:hypothetical protein
VTGAEVVNCEMECEEMRKDPSQAVERIAIDEVNPDDVVYE